MNFSLNLRIATVQTWSTLVDIDATINDFHVVQNVLAMKYWLRIGIGYRSMHIDISRLRRAKYHIHASVAHSDDPFHVLYDAYRTVKGTHNFRNTLSRTTYDITHYTNSNFSVGIYDPA